MSDVLPSPGIDPAVSGPLLERAVKVLAEAIDLLNQAGGDDWATDVEYVYHDVIGHLDDGEHSDGGDGS